ncbi:hypothetical protein DS745_03385 [Anaerobacillus alkaliphilus]|uniref:Uncharacterized protein n=1 Tax=Anaerobacillus alkaliphilus TaxID=1548597 RepID=A0A4Q0VYG2_9BACI|nr:hypothetical protein DS745_03385 [Anaerobacillus alkaliphilus]
MKELFTKLLLVMFFIGVIRILFKHIFTYISSYVSGSFGFSVIILLIILIISLIATQWFQGLRMSGKHKSIIVIIILLLSV